MRRDDLQKIAEAKLRDAQFLLQHGRFGNAFYLAGYAVEIGLKACIARQILAEMIPDKRFVQSIYDHDLSKLVNVAGLGAALKARQKNDVAFDANWAIVTEWRPESRYESVDPFTAGLLIAAVSDRNHGILEWIRAYW